MKPFHPLILICLTLFLQLHYSEGGDSFNGSRLGTKDYREEMNVINEGKIDYEVSKSSYSHRKPLLCTVFAKASRDASINLYSNMLVMKSECDWAIIFYSGTYTNEKRICRHSELAKHLVLCIRARDTIRVVNGIDVSNSKEYASKSIPKTVLYQELLPLLPKYKRVFLLDEDVSLIDFDRNKFFAAWDCAFPNQAPPLIVQPVVAEDTQFFDFVSQSSWRGKGVVASAAGLVEQQAPLFDSIFFEWFVKRVLTRTKHVALANGVDWGHDRSWCNAASMFSSEILQWSSKTVVCAIITVSAIHHLNTHSMALKRANKEQFRVQGNRVVQHYIDLYPTWVLTDITDLPNPLDSHFGKKYKKIEALNATCLMERRKMDPM